MGTSCFTDFALAPTARRLLFTAQDYPGLLDLAFRSPCLAATVNKYYNQQKLQDQSESSLCHHRNTGKVLPWPYHVFFKRL
ncbi:MAG: hypothetical protein ACO2ZM_04625 [Francisellaceae bacterium]